MDITVFEELYQIANEEIRDVQVLLKDFKKTDYDVQLMDANSLHKDYITESKEVKSKNSKLKKPI